MTGQGPGNLSGGAAGAGNGENALVLGVDIDESTALQLRQVDDVRAQHADLFVHGNDDFQRGMGDGIVSQDGQGIGHGNAVIAAQGGAVGKNIRAVMGQIQAIGFKMDGAIRLLLTDHVHVALDDHRGVILVPGRAALEQDHIVGLILDIAQAVFLGEAHQVVRNGFGVPGAMGDGANLLKITENGRGLQPGQNVCFHYNDLTFKRI